MSVALLESLLWRPGEGYFLLDFHIDRLRASALEWSRPFNEAVLRVALAEATRDAGTNSKVRLVFDERGGVTIDREPVVDEEQKILRLGLAREGVRAEDPWLRHKSVRREFYNQARASRPDCDDVLLWNEKGEITEASSSNVVFPREGNLWTPPLACGLLPGTLRRHCLETGEIHERVLRIEELNIGVELFLINSVRKWRAAVFIG